MPIPLKVTVYDPGAGGIPTTTNPRDLSGWAETFSDSLLNELGCETCRITGRVASIEAAVDWTQRLMAAIEVYTPRGRPRFFGFLHEVSIPALECSVSLTDMANAVIVRYTDPDGKKGTSTATNSGSIAQFGRKELVLNFSTAYAAEATNRAATVLAQLAYPPNKETVSVDGTDGGGSVAIELTFRGWAEALKWLTTSSTTTATAVTSTQVTSLITAYNSTNAFFDTTAASVVATGFSATQYCDPDTTYFERIATLLAAGNSSQQRVAWGFYSRAITIGTAASATPDTIAYYYSKRTRTLRDVYGNVIPVWDWAPDTMIQNVDAIEPPFPTGTIATLTKKYIKRVSLSIDKDGKVSGTLEPDDPDKLPEFLAKPVSVTSGVSARHAQIEARIARTAKVRTIAADNTTIYNPSTGVLNPSAGGTGIANTGTIDLGGGSINTGGGSVSNTGGGSIDLGTGSGIGGVGSSGVTSSGGTTGRVAEWSSTTALTAATLIKSGAGVLTFSAANTSTITIGGSSGGTLTLGGNVLTLTGNFSSNGGTFNGAGTTLTTDQSIRLSNSGPSSGDVLTYDGTKYAPVAPTVYAPTNAKYITQTSDATLTNEQALSSLSTGMVKVTTTTGVLSSVAGTSGRMTEWSDATTIGASTLIKSGAGVLTLSASGTVTLTIDSTTRIDGAGASSGQALTWDGTAYSPSAVPSGTGTTGRVAEWASSSSLQAATLIKSGAGVLTLSASTTETLTVTDGGSLSLGGNSVTLTGNFASNGGTFNGFGTTLTVSTTGTAVVGTGQSGRIAFWNGTNTLTHASGMSYDSGTDRITSTNITVGTNLRVDGYASAGSMNINSSSSPSHTFMLTGSDDAAKSSTSSWTVTSDRRSKTILAPYTRGLAFLRALPPIYEYEHNGRFGTVAGMRSMNFIAQDIEHVAPAWISHDTHEDEDGTTTDVLRLNSHEHIYAIHNAVLRIAALLGLED